jgi:hypothetical protein
VLRPDDKRLVFDRIGYKPSPEQQAVHDDTSLVRLVAGGERAGKSRLAAAEVMGNSPDGSLFWLLGRDYAGARGEFSYCVEDAQKLNAIERNGLSMPDEGRWTMRLKGGIEISTFSADDPLKIATKAPSGIVLCEAGQHDFSTFMRVFARTAEGRAKGEGWLLLAGTFERAQRWYAELHRKGRGPNEFGLRSHSLSTWSNLAAFPGGRTDPAIKAMEAALPPDSFMERFGGVPAVNEGVVFREFEITTHVKPIRFGPVETDMRDGEGWVLPERAPIEIWVDPGYAGAYAVLFVCIQGGRVFVVDEVYAKGKTGEQVILEVQSKRHLWDRTTAGVIDVAAKQHHAMASQIEVWQRVTGLYLQSQPVAVPDGILRHRTFLNDPFTQTPRIFFDPKCKNTIWEHSEGYRYADVKPNRDTRERPIDTNNHSCKAIAYGLIARFGFIDQGRQVEAPSSLRQHPRNCECTECERRDFIRQANDQAYSDTGGWLD